MEDIVKRAAKIYRSHPDHINATINLTDRDTQKCLFLSVFLFYGKEL